MLKRIATVNNDGEVSVTDRLGDAHLRVVHRATGAWGSSTALSRSDIIFTTGGLGPTVDDITLSTLARVCFKHLDFNKHVSKDINSYFKN